MGCTPTVTRLRYNLFKALTFNLLRSSCTLRTLIDHRQIESIKFIGWYPLCAEPMSIPTHSNQNLRAPFVWLYFWVATAIYSNIECCCLRAVLWFIHNHMFRWCIEKLVFTSQILFKSHRLIFFSIRRQSYWSEQKKKHIIKRLNSLLFRALFTSTHIQRF